MNYIRLQGGSKNGINTHQWKSYRLAFEWALKQTNHVDGVIVDPFARKCPWADLRNDIDEKQPTAYHQDAADWLEWLDKIDTKAKIILFDPPYSDRQSEKYEVGDTNLYTTGDGRMKRMGKSMAGILAPGGMIIKLGYNSSKPHVSLTLKKLFVVNFGGTRNDVLISIWMRENRRLDEFVSAGGNL